MLYGVGGEDYYAISYTSGFGFLFIFLYFSFGGKRKVTKEKPPTYKDSVYVGVTLMMLHCYCAAWLHALIVSQVEKSPQPIDY